MALYLFEFVPFGRVVRTYVIRFAGIIGNFLEHYDSALFGFLAPFLAPLFFPEGDPVTALFLTYGMLPLGLLSKPLGALYFGWMGDHLGLRHALVCSLLGMAVVTTGMGFLPLYRDVGVLAPILLALGRMLQGFFAAGVLTGGVLFVLERTEEAKRSWVSSLYDAFSVGGILLASVCVALLGDHLESGWRILFWAGGVTALIGAFLRRKVLEEKPFVKPKRVWGKALFALILASGFSHAIFSFSCVFMNGFVPLVTAFSKVDMIQLNTFLLVVDIMVLPCFGYLASKYGKALVMLLGALGSVVCVLTLFPWISQASLSAVIAIRVSLVVCGCAFAAPYYAWAIEQVVPEHRYRVLALGSVIGSQLLGAPTPAIGLWLYKILGGPVAPTLYLALLGLLAGFVVYLSHRKRYSREEPSRAEVWKMFDEIASTYDVTNRVMTFGLDQLWRKRMCDYLPEGKGLRVLDVATGTGDQILSLLQHSNGIDSVVGIDLSEEMLSIARRKLQGCCVELHLSSALDLPFPDHHFDVVTISFGVRNVTDLSRALEEAYRVLKPSGRLLILEGTLPNVWGIRTLHQIYSRYCLPKIGGWISKKESAYRYLNRTIETFPSGSAFLEEMRQVGFEVTQAHSLTWGSVTIYQGDKRYD